MRASQPGVQSSIPMVSRPPNAQGESPVGVILPPLLHRGRPSRATHEVGGRSWATKKRAAPPGAAQPASEEFSGALLGGRNLDLKLVVDAHDTLDGAGFSLGVLLDAGIRHFAGERHDAVRHVDIDVDDV